MECYHLHKSLKWVFGIGLNRKRFQRKTLKRRGLNIELHGTTFSKFFHLLKVVYFYLLFPMIRITFCYQKRMCKTKLILFLLSRYLFHFSIITSKVCCAFWRFRNPHWYLQKIGSENIRNCLKSQFFKNFKDNKQNTDRPVFLFINSRLFLKSWFDSWRWRMWENLNVVIPSLKWYILNSEKKSWFAGIILTGISFCSIALVASSEQICLLKPFSATAEKLKCYGWFSFIFMILERFWNF